MATTTMVPYSNPAGNNQTTGISKVPTATSTTQPAPIASPVSSTTPAQTNPFVPTTSSSIIGTPQLNNPTSVTSSDLNAQLTDIYGTGVGTSLADLYGSMSGTNSAALQEFITSLAPKEATAQTNLDASLGASGVGANSSVAAIGNANLQAQEFGAISGEEAALTENQQQMEAQILESTMPTAEKQVATTPLSIFGNVMGSIGSDLASIFSFGL